MTYAAIDPSGCGCTDCTVGAAVPLDQATHRQVIMALLGFAPLQTEEPITITVSMTVTREDLEHPWLPTHRECVTKLLTVAREKCMSVRVTRE